MTDQFAMSCQSVRRAAHDDRGSVMMLFGVIVMVLFGGMALAVDYGRVTAAKSHAQTALDAAVLAASDILVPDNAKQALFDATFRGNFRGSAAEIAELDFNYSSAQGGVGKVTTQLPTYFMGLFGKSHLNIEVESRAAQQNPDLEVVFVLDISGSMRAAMGGGTRIQALKSSAKKLIDMLEDSKSANQSIKYAIVPFTMTVNIGTANAQYVYNDNHALFTGTSWAGCVLERPGTHANSDEFNTGSALGGGRWHAYIWPPAPNSGLLSCRNPSDGTNNGYRTVADSVLGNTINPWTPGPNFNCVRQAIVPLTDSADSITTAIDALTPMPNMGTIVAPGVAWGHRVLSADEPFTGGAAFASGTRKIMIVITDGEQTTEGPWNDTGCDKATNTDVKYEYDPAAFDLHGKKINNKGPRDMFSPYGYLLDSDTLGNASNFNDVSDQLETLSLDACAQFKARDNDKSRLELYTIAASSGAGPGTKVYNMLRNCATDQDHFFYASDSETLEETFKEIGRNSTNLRLTQ